MNRRFRETVGNRELGVRWLQLEARTEDILGKHLPEFVAYFETQFALEPFPYLVRQMGSK